MQSVGDVLLLVKSDAVEEREGESAAGYGLGKGKAYGGAGVGQPGGLLMDGSEVAPGCDAALVESGLHLIAIYGVGKANDIDEPTDGTVRESEWGEFQAGNVAKELVVALGRSMAEGENFFDAGELNAAKSAGDFGETIVVAGFGVIQPATCG